MTSQFDYTESLKPYDGWREMLYEYNNFLSLLIIITTWKFDIIRELRANEL